MYLAKERKKRIFRLTKDHRHLPMKIEGGKTWSQKFCSKDKNTEKSKSSHNEELYRRAQEMTKALNLRWQRTWGNCNRFRHVLSNRWGMMEWRACSSFSSAAVKRRRDSSLRRDWTFIRSQLSQREESRPWIIRKARLHSDIIFVSKAVPGLRKTGCQAYSKSERTIAKIASGIDGTGLALPLLHPKYVLLRKVK